MPEFCGGRTGQGRASHYPSFSASGDGKGVCGDAVQAVYEDYDASVIMENIAEQKQGLRRE